MAKLVTGILLIALVVGCTSREERQAREQAADDQQCQRMGIAFEHPRYLECRAMLMQLRAQEAAAAQRNYNALGRQGAVLMQQGQPTIMPTPMPQSFTCYRQGIYVTCR